MALIPASVSEPFLYLFGVKNAIFCKCLDKLSPLRIASELSLRSLIDNFVSRVLFYESTCARCVYMWTSTRLLARGFDIQEITLTFRLRRNLGGTSEMLKQVWHFTRFALNLPFQNGGTRQKRRWKSLTYTFLGDLPAANVGGTSA